MPDIKKEKQFYFVFYFSCYWELFVLNEMLLAVWPEALPVVVYLLNELLTFPKKIINCCL